MVKMKYRGSLLLCLVNVVIAFHVNGCSGSGDSSASFSAAFQQKVLAAFVESVGANGFPGGVLGIMRPGDDATFLAATGMAEALSIVNTDQRLWTAKTSMTADTRFRIASVTKPFTATMILILVDQDVLSLDQTIENFFPGLVPNSSIITLRNLLNMTSGLYDHEEYPPMVEYITCGDLIQHFSPEELIELSNTYGKGRVLFEPGEYFKYVNTNFTILAMIAQQATNKTYKELITSMIIDRLALAGTSVPGDYDVDMPAPYTHGYDICSETSVWKDYSVQNMSWDLGAGNIISTAGDLLRMIKAIYTGELISAELKEEMLTPPEVHDYDHKTTLSNYGLGMFISGDMVTHTGANPGYNAFFAFYRGYYVSILLNAGEGVRLGKKLMTTGVGYILEDVFNAIEDM